MVTKDQGKARELLLRAAKQGYPDAQHALGHMYLHGWGGAKDASEGARWVKEVAEQGNVEAQVLLAALFLTGEGVKKDETAAYMWLSVEGSRGDADTKRLRDILSRHMSSEQIANAEKLAKEWKPKRSTQP